jgi:hypothetical protein
MAGCVYALQGELRLHLRKEPSMMTKTRLNNKSRHQLLIAALVATSASALEPAQAATGKLVLTGGVSTIEGASGGGLTPWATIGSNATAGQIGVSPYVSRAEVDDYDLTAYGVAVGIHDRFEISFGHQKFDTGPALHTLDAALGLPSPTFGGLDLKQNIFGVKVRLAGEAILDSHTLMPQIAIGLQHKRLSSNLFTDVVVENVLGAKRSGTDLYISATKLFLAHGVLVNGTLRATKANQNGLLGFGANSDDDYSIQPEVSVAYLLRKDLAVGFEYRAMPNKLKNEFVPGALSASDWKDIFIAWAPSKNLSLTAAYVDLGKIAPGLTNNRDQRGVYLSLQALF